MSWIFAEMDMLFCCLGVAFFFSAYNFQFLQDRQCGEILKLTEEVVASNLEREIELVKIGKGLPQGIQRERSSAYTRDQINSMRSDQLKGVLEEIGFPTLNTKEERLEALNLLLFETEEEKMKVFEEKYGKCSNVAFGCWW